MRHLTPLTRAAMPPCIQLFWDTETRNINHTFDMRNSSNRKELLSNATQVSLNIRSPLDTSTAPSSSASSSTSTSSTSTSSTSTSTSSSSSLTEAYPYPCSMFSFLGDVLCPEVACAIADGHMDPSTRVISSPATLYYSMQCCAILCITLLKKISVEVKCPLLSKVPSINLSTHTTIYNHS